LPSQSHSGIRGVPWSRCDRCGYDYPVDKLAKQNGLILCVEKCIDKTLVWERDAIIAAKLQNIEEEPKIASILKGDDEEDTIAGFFF
jgi:hypothetical protein